MVYITTELHNNRLRCQDDSNCILVTNQEGSVSALAN